MILPGRRSTFLGEKSKGPPPGANKRSVRANDRKVRCNVIFSNHQGKYLRVWSIKGEREKSPPIEKIKARVYIYGKGGEEVGSCGSEEFPLK